MSDERARSVVAWIKGAEDRGDLDEHFEDVLIDHRFARGKALLLSPPPLLPLDLDVWSAR